MLILYTFQCKYAILNSYVIIWILIKDKKIFIHKQDNFLFKVNKFTFNDMKNLNFEENGCIWKPIMWLIIPDFC